MFSGNFCLGSNFKLTGSVRWFLLCKWNMDVMLCIVSMGICFSIVSALREDFRLKFLVNTLFRL